MLRSKWLETVLTNFVLLSKSNPFNLFGRNAFCNPEVTNPRKKRVLTGAKQLGVDTSETLLNNLLLFSGNHISAHLGLYLWHVLLIKIQLFVRFTSLTFAFAEKRMSK